MSKKQSNLISISEGIQDFVRANHLEQGFDRIRIREVWNRLMGKPIEAYTTDVQLRGETLIVSLSSSVLREELSYGKNKIIQMINEEFGKKMIEKLVLK
ncbi:MAG: DUF721 domain-containing protein [Flavobacteriales bacterium CG_4_9_14_3_um_filter_40_17]|nr:MAG: DUF721 domain-containing protein [Flavobacteriales bacterium CG_4_9_14_3_um_filter_40_17]